MFCHKCGQEIRDGQNACPRCGAPVKYKNLAAPKTEPVKRAEPAREPEKRRREEPKAVPPVPQIQPEAAYASGEAKPKKKKTGLLIVLALLLAAGVGAYFFLTGGTKIDLNDYLTVTYEDYGRIDARVGFAVRRLIKDHAEALAVTDKNRSGLRKYLQETYSMFVMDTLVDAAIDGDIVTAQMFYGETRTRDEALAELVLIAALADAKNPGGQRGAFPEDHYEPEMMKGKLDRNTDLKDGETITFTWGEIDAKKVEELFKVKLTWSNRNFTVDSKKTPGSSAEQPSGSAGDPAATGEAPLPSENPLETKEETEKTPETYSYVTMYVVNCDKGIPMYRDPNTASGKICEILYGEAVSFMETAENGFSRIAYSGMTGYVFAANLSEDKPAPRETQETRETNRPTEPAPIEMKSVFFGHFDQDDNGNNGQEPIEWLIFVESDQYAWMISKYVLAAGTHSDTPGNIAYDYSMIRQYLNGSFLNLAFTAQERAKLIPMTVDANPNPDHPSVSAGKDVVDPVAILSVYEVNKYFKTPESRLSYASDNAIHWGVFVAENGCSPWWTRTPGSDNTKMSLVRSDGSINTDGRTGENIFGVRPIICLRKSDLK